VYLRSWSPAAGYTVDEVHRGPAEAAEIKFRSSGGHDDEVSLRVTCRAGTPTSSSDGSSDHRD
jgi:hypothetical protein